MWFFKPPSTPLLALIVSAYFWPIVFASVQAINTNPQNAAFASAFQSVVVKSSGGDSSGPQQGWVCRPQREGWCTVAIVVEYNNMPNIHSELFDNTCLSLALIPHMSWEGMYVFSTPALPRNVRIKVHPVVSAVAPDYSEFWYGDGHWIGNWEQYIDGNMSDNNFKGISTRPFDCSFAQGHNISEATGLEQVSARVGLLLGVLWMWFMVF